jgi:putative FmdB family regulatory protein
MYSYACRDCDHRFDIQQAFTDDALTECPQCGGGLRKLFSAVGVVFKGSGFYRTDSRSSRETSTPTGGSSGSASGSSASSSSDSSSSSSGKPAGSSSTASAPAAKGA